jgi:hypothetical protein
MSDPGAEMQQGGVMAQRPRENEPELTVDVENSLDALGQGDFQALLAARRAQALQAAAAQRPPSRLRPPREDVVTYRVKLHLVGSQPPIWRRLELASVLTLDSLHDIVQIAMGWTDSHLHRFSVGGDPYDAQAEQYPTDFDLEEGDEGTPEREVRLDQVLQEVGDKLHYEYDFGDGWSHVIRLEAIQPRAESDPVAVCTGGRRACPVEDVGGIHTWNELVCYLEDGGTPSEPWLAEKLAWLGGDVYPDWFDRDQVNAQLRFAAPMADVDVAVRDRLVPLIERTAPRLRSLVRWLVADAHLDEVPALDPDAVARAVRPYSWLLRRVGEDGVQLTSAGYLPPALVKDLVRETGVGRSWIGTHSRESDTLPVLEFRESAQLLGLLRKQKGRLLLTAAGKAALDDPQGLWRHIATRLPVGRHPVERDAGTVLLLLAAAARPPAEPAYELIAAVLGALGWTVAGDIPDRHDAVEAAAPTWEVLHRLCGLPESLSRSLVPTDASRALARAALSGRASLT